MLRCRQQIFVPRSSPPAIYFASSLPSGIPFEFLPSCSLSITTFPRVFIQAFSRSHQETRSEDTERKRIKRQSDFRIVWKSCSSFLKEKPLTKQIAILKKEVRRPTGTHFRGPPRIEEGSALGKRCLLRLHGMIGQYCFLRAFQKYDIPYK